MLGKNALILKKIVIIKKGKSSVFIYVLAKVIQYRKFHLCTFEWNGRESNSLRGEGRSGWEGRVKNGVRIKHMIT